MRRLLFFWVWALLLAGSISAGALGLIVVDEAHWLPPRHPLPPRPIPSQWPPRWMPAPRPYAPLELRSARVNTTISDQVAATRVDQEFYNPNAARLEGTFIFPIPPGAHLDRFTMEIDGVKVDAELLSAAKARELYEGIVRKAQDPALMEYAGGELFKVRIFPIEPNRSKRVTISYTQLLKSDRGLVAFTLPLSAGRFSSAPPRELSAKIELNTRRPLKSIYSPTHNLEIKRRGEKEATAGFEMEGAWPEPDLVLYFAPEEDDVGLHLITHRRAGEDGYFLLLASPGLAEDNRKVVPRDLVFVLDTSGSMAGKKLDQARKALEFCVENLNDGDRFEIIRFATEVEALFGKLTRWDSGSREGAREFIRRLKPLGGTAIDEALRKALGTRENSGASGKPGEARPLAIIFLTDGRPTIGVTDEQEILAGLKTCNTERTRVFCFGIGTDVNTHFLDKLAGHTRGSTEYVLPEEDLEVKVSSFFARIKDPVLSDPALKFPGGIRVSKLHPTELPDLFLGEQLVLAGRYSGKGDAAIILNGEIAGSTRKFTYEANFPEREEANEFIARLWATRRVGYLLDAIRLRGENAELREEVTELAREYGIVTPYTSYLIVEDEARRQVPERLRSFQNFDRDSAARAAGRQAWGVYKSEKAGDVAVLGARNNSFLRSAQAPSASAGGSLQESRRALGISMAAKPSASGQPVDERERLAQYSQQSRFVAGKNFFENEGQWLDAAVQSQAKAKARQVRIKFGSPEYFELAQKHPETRPWLALGNNVQFVVADTIYDIYER